jgi:hypothetical protein
MIVTYVMVVVCVVGVIGAVASVLGYEQPYGDIGSPMRIPRRSRQRVQRSRPSRQLQALEAALAEEAPTPHLASGARVAEHEQVALRRRGKRRTRPPRGRR